ncbi:MAG: type II toxin-antitoxin system VapC family toxin [Nitrososphaerales archaeon]
MGTKDKEIENEKSDQPYVIDASALYPLLLRMNGSAFVKLLSRFRVLDLTKYELGSAARYDRKLEDDPAFMERWKDIFDSIGEGSITSLAEVQRLATENSITFYDAAYVQVAIHLGSKLITMDREILEKFESHVIDLDSFEKEI